MLLRQRRKLLTVSQSKLMLKKFNKVRAHAFSKSSQKYFLIYVVKVAFPLNATVAYDVGISLHGMYTEEC